MMMASVEMRCDDVATEYWRAYFEWRAQYGLSDECIQELLAAIRVECESNFIEAEDLARLQRLTRMIEIELLRQQLRPVA